MFVSARLAREHWRLLGEAWERGIGIAEGARGVAVISAFDCQVSLHLLGSLSLDGIELFCINLRIRSFYNKKEAV
jgi:hypothetical protein